MTSMQKHTDINPETLTVKDLSIPQLDESQFHRPTVQDFKGDLSTTAPKFLLLYGSLRERSFSRLVIEECARLLTAMGAEVKIYNPAGLPLVDDADSQHPKVQELYELVNWCEGMIWCSPERHGAMTGVMKTQIDWIPLSMGAVRPTQGKTLAVMQVSGGSQSFNAVNQMRILGRWMRLLTIPNQSSVAKAFLFIAAYALEWVDEPNSAITDKATFTTGWVVLAALLFGFFVFEPMGVPISVIAGLGAAVLLAVATMGKKLPILPVVKNAPWQIVIFSLGMYLVVYGLKNAGLTDYLATLLQGLEQQGLLVATVGTGFLSAILSSVMNNMPTVLIQALAIDGAHITSPMIKEAMVFANVIGCDLGPKITPIGSLATLLWLHVLATKNIKVSWGYYFKVGMILTIPVLLATLVALVGWLSLIN